MLERPSNEVDVDVLLTGLSPIQHAADFVKSFPLPLPAEVESFSFASLTLEVTLAIGTMFRVWAA